jgi:hypothetical protein
MIFYTIKGPSHLLEIHEDKLILKKRIWSRILTGAGIEKTWELNKLREFKIQKQKYFIWGKLEWKDENNQEGKIRFSINTLMMERITKYLQKKIEKKIIDFKKNRTTELKEAKKQYPIESNIAA